MGIKRIIIIKRWRKNDIQSTFDITLIPRISVIHKN